MFAVGSKLLVTVVALIAASCEGLCVYWSGTFYRRVLFYPV